MLEAFIGNTVSKIFGIPSQIVDGFTSIFSGPKTTVNDMFADEDAGLFDSSNFLRMGAKAFGQSMTDKERQYFSAPKARDPRSVKDLTRLSPSSSPISLTPTQTLYQNERVRQYGLALANSSNDHVKNAFAAAGIDRVPLTAASGRKTTVLAAPKLSSEVDVT